MEGRCWQPTLVTQVPLEPSVAVQTELGKEVTWKMLETVRISHSGGLSSIIVLLKLLLSSCLGGPGGVRCWARIKT